MGSATEENRVTEERDVCESCGGSGETEKMEHVTGDDIIPGGFFDGSGEFETCKDCNGSGVN